MKLSQIVHRVIYALPVVSCLLFIILFLKIKYTLYKLDTAIERYNKSIQIADRLLRPGQQNRKSSSTPDSVSVIPMTHYSPTNSSKDTLVRKNKVNFGTASNHLPAKTALDDNSFPINPDAAVQKIEPNFADFEGSYEKEVVINRSDKFTKLNLSIRYRFMADSNFNSIPPSKGVINISETTNFGRKTTHELNCKLSSVQIIGPDQIKFVFKEPEIYKSTYDTNPINNKLQRKFIFIASVNKNNISGILNWEDLADDMMSYSVIKVPITLSIK